ncbi:MAG: hypothetical protein JSU65_07590, partial [Candidatus Zixiibacteriota bacterium]
MKGSCLLFAAALLIMAVATGCEEDADTGTGVERSPLPSVRIVSPVNDEPVCDYVELVATASDDKGVAEVKFYVDANWVGSDAAPPYSVIWDASAEDHASVHSIYGVAYDTDENKVGSPTVLCVIDTGLATPDAPIIHAIDSVTGTTARVVWSANADVDFGKYVLRYDTASSGDPSLHSVDILNAVDTAYTIMDLRDTTTYYIQVLVQDVFDRMAASAVEEVTTPNVAPPKPVIYSVLRYSDRIRFLWTPATIWDFADYKLVRSVDSEFELSDEVLTTLTDIDTAVFDYVTADTTDYYYFLVVTDIYDLSTHSDAYYGASEAEFALEYNGSTYATVPYFTGLNLGNTYTLEVWIFQTGRSDYMRVIDKSPPGSPYLQYSLISDDYLGADVCGDGAPQRFHADVGVALNEWHHIALSYDFGVI